MNVICPILKSDPMPAQLLPQLIIQLTDGLKSKQANIFTFFKKRQNIHVKGRQNIRHRAMAQERTWMSCVLLEQV